MENKCGDKKRDKGGLKKRGGLKMGLKLKREPRKRVSKNRAKNRARFRNNKKHLELKPTCNFRAFNLKAFLSLKSVFNLKVYFCVL